MNRSHIPPLAIILSAAALVRLWGIGGIMPTMDEIQFFIIAQGNGITEIWERARAEVHPPLVWIIRHYLLLISGDFTFHRLVSVGAGLATVVGAYHLGKALLQQRGAGIAFAAAFAFMPAAVTASISLRNYSFLMLFSVWAMTLLVRWLHNQKAHNLAGFALFLLLAGSSHFSGFLVAAVCGLAAGLALMWQRNIRAFFMLCTAYLPLLGLGAFFYSYYFAAGTTIPMWQTYLKATGFTPQTPEQGLMAQLVIPLISYFSPFVQAVNETTFTSEATASLTRNAVILGSLALMLLYGFGLYSLRRNRIALLFALMLWVVALPLSVSGLYAISANRHCFYMLPFFLIPLVSLATPKLGYLLNSRLSLAGCSVFAALCLATNMAVIWKDPDLRFRTEDYEEGQRYLHSHLQPGDVIVTGPMGAYFYLHYAHNKGALPYHTYVDTPYYNNSTLLAPFASPYKPYSSWQPFREDLAKRLNDGSISGSARLWFVQYGWKSGEVWALMTCPQAHPIIEHFMSRDNVAVFSITAEALKLFVKNHGTWEHCYKGFRPLVVGTPFPAFTRDYDEQHTR